MANWLKQSTAVDIALGPFLDEDDGKTAETGLTISQADVRLKKNAGNWAQKNQSSSATHEEAGWYEVSLNTTDTDTLGLLLVAVHEAGALPVWREFMVVAANVYDSLVGGGDLLDVSLAQWLGSAPNALSSGRVDATVGAMQANVMTAAAAASDLTTELQSGLATASALATVDGVVDGIAAAVGTVDTVVDAIKVTTDKLDDTLEDQGGGTYGFTEAALQEAPTGSGGGLDAAGVRAAVGLASANLDTQLGAIDTVVDGLAVDLATVDGVVDTIQAKTDLLPASPAATGDIPTASAIADAVWDEALSGHQSAGSAGEALDAAGAAVGIAGPGALTRTIRVRDGDNPIEGASVWVATDAGGTNVIAGPLTTSGMGIVTVLLDAGTYYVWVQKDGFGAIIGDEIEVSA